MSSARITSRWRPASNATGSCPASAGCSASSAGSNGGRAVPVAFFWELLLEHLLILRVEEALADERDSAQERFGIPVAAHARQLDVQRHRRSDDAQPGSWFRNRADNRLELRRADVDQRALPLEQDAGRRGEHARDAPGRKARQLGRIQLHVIGRQDLRPQDHRPLRTLRLVGRPRSLLRLCEVDLDVGAGGIAHVDQSRVHRHAGAVDHDGIGRRLRVGADGIDDAVPQDDRPTLDRRARHRDEPGSLDRIRARRIRASGQPEGHGGRGNTGAESNPGCHGGSPTGARCTSGRARDACCRARRRVLR